MEKSKIVVYSLVHALAVLAYIVGVAYLLEYGAGFFSGYSGILATIPMLLLLVFSVALMGVLIFARPVYLFINGFKSQAIEFLIYTLGWILVILILVFGYMALMSSNQPPPNYYY